MLRRPFAALIAVLLPLALMCGATAKPRPADSDPSGTVRITPSTGGVTRDEGDLTGTSGALAYVQSAPASNDYQGNEIFVRTSNGRTTDLGAAPNDPDGAFSLVGTSLIEPIEIGEGVYWWNTATRTSGTITLSSDQAPVTAAPDGFVYEQDGTAYDYDIANGSSTSLGSLFGGASFRAVGGSDGLLAMDGTADKYLAWATPGQVSDVDTGGLALACSVVEGDYAGCVSSYSGGTPELVKLDGSGPVSMPGVSAAFGSVALAGSTIVAVHDSHLYSRSYASSRIAMSSAEYGNSMTSAFGRAVAETPDYSTVQTVTSATATPSTLVRAPYGPVEAATYDVSPGQIVDVDNRRNAADPPGQQSMVRTPLATDAASAQVGAASTVASGLSKNQYTASTPLASGTTTAVSADYHDDVKDYDQTESLTVTGPHRSHTIVKVNLGGTPQLSGNRLVYYSQDAARPGFYLYDLAKNTTTLVLAINAAKTNDYLPVPAISGNYVAIMHVNGEVTRLDLNTGTSTVVSPADKDFEPNYGGSVWDRGDWVGWTRADYVNEDGYDFFGGYRDAATTAAPVTDNDIEGLAATGVIDFVRPGFDTPNVLRLFAGGSVHLPQTDEGDFSGSTSYLPQVEGRTVVWLNSGQVLRAAPLDIHPAPPRMEGETLAPKPAMSNVKWHPYVPYSEQLTSCSATVTSGTRTVATLPCNKAYMTEGVADLAWNGMTGSHHDPAGTYHYTITAAGDGGGALDSAGATAPVAGHFAIG